MINGTDSRLESIDAATLTPLVRQALGSDTVEITSWDCQQIYGGAALAAIFRFSGDGQDRGEVVPWSLVLKSISRVINRIDRDKPTGPQYWKREVLAYQTGLVDDLPGSLTAPRCLGIVEQPDGGYWIWMEDVKDDLGAEWPLDHYGVVARHLGEFNGAYLVGRPIPVEGWMSKSWLRSTLAEPRAAAGIAQLRNSLEHQLVRRTYPPSVAESVYRFWAEREAVLDALSKLPRTLCHFDAYRRNLFARREARGGWETVVIDWAFVGPGAVGEDIVPLVAATLMFQDVAAAQAAELDSAVFEGYLSGLRIAGWDGDERLARLGYTAASTLRYGTAYTRSVTASLLEEIPGAQWARRIGRSSEEVIDQIVVLMPFLHRLGDEVWELLDEL